MKPLDYYKVPPFIDRAALTKEVIDIKLSVEGKFQLVAVEQSIDKNTILPDEIIKNITFDDFEEAYEYIRKQGFSARFDDSVGELVFGPVIEKRYDSSDEKLSSEELQARFESEPVFQNRGNSLGGIMQYTKRVEGAYQCFDTTEPDYWLTSIEDDYRDFIECHLAEYDKNPDDFMTAYEFLNNHPTFWTRLIKDRSKYNRKDYISWHTHEGISTLYASPIPKEITSKEYDWCMEGGAHVERDDHEIPAYTTCYHDWKLDSWGASYEEACINFAKNVRKHLPLDGSPRESTKEDKEFFNRLLNK